MTDGQVSAEPEPTFRALDFFHIRQLKLIYLHNYYSMRIINHKQVKRRLTGLRMDTYERLNLPSRVDMEAVLRTDDKKLPSFPQVAAKLIEASNDENSSLADMSKIIETDPGISVKILEIVNSAMYGLGRKISSLSEAVVYLGLDELKKLALGMTIFEKIVKTGRHERFNRLLFWRHCLAVAVLCKEIALKSGYPDPDEAYLAGLLHDVGKALLDIGGKKDFGRFIQQLSESSGVVIEEEREHIGIGHDDVGAFFCASWKLPERLVLPVKFHHQSFNLPEIDSRERLLIAIVSLSDFLCWTQGIGSFDFIRPPILCPDVGQTIDLDKINVIECIVKMNEEIEKISQFYHFVFPSPVEIRENLLWANIRLSNANTRYYFQEDPFKQIDKTLPDADFFRVGKLLAKAKTIKEVLDIVMYQVGRIFQPQNWSILLKDPKTEEMVFSSVVGTNKDKLSGVKLPKGEGIAGHIMETGESLIIEDVTKDEHFSIRMDEFTGFTTRSIIGTPLKTGDKCFGVIELVNRICDDLFTIEDLALLSSIAEYAAIAIERAYYNQALTNLATKDPLTGFKNRWSFEKAIASQEEARKQFGDIFSILIITLNSASRDAEEKLSTILDKAIKALGKTLLQTKRQKDVPFRYAEKTLLLILPETYSEGAQSAKQRIEKAFWGAVPQEFIPILKTDIQPYTVNAEDARHLKNTVQKFLTRPSQPSDEEVLVALEDNIQPLVAEETRKAIESQDSQPSGGFGKSVSLGGEFIRLKTGESGHIRVEQVSLIAIGFRISRSHRIQINDFLDIQFVLDDLKKSLVKRRAVVRDIQGNYIQADFYNPPPYAKRLGFYLLS